jgi:tetratricopeptide (TPR) repeat protein
MKRAGRVLVAAALGAVISAARAAAQSPAERAGLDSLRSSIESLGDSTALLAREQARIAVARQTRDDPFIHLELGFLAYRLGEVTGQHKHYDDAAGEFEWASELRPDWPYPWYWLGQAELALGESRIIPLENLRQILGADELSKAARAFARAAQADPSFSRALVDIGTTALRQRIAPRLTVAQRALRLAAGTAASEQPAVLLVRGRVERELDANDSALAAFRAYVSLGGDPALGGLEIARSYFAVGQPDSAIGSYHAAAAHRPVSDSAKAEFRREVFWVASGDDLRTYDALPNDSIGPWLRRFWSRRDVVDARLPGDRIVEQLRRYAYARKSFRLLTPHRHYDIAEIYRDSVQSEFDDRGVIYLRHGEPDARARYVGDENVHPNETWAYRRGAGEADLVFHFVSRGHVQDYKLVGSLLDAYDFSTAVALASPADHPTSVVEGLLNSRLGIAPIYEQLLRGGMAGRTRLLAQERREVLHSAQVGTTTDSYPLRFARDLRPVVTSFAVADSAGRGALHVVFAIPAGALAPFSVASGGVAYPLQLRVVVFDDQQREIASLDTLRIFRSAAPLPPGSFLTEQLALPVATGSYRFHFVAEELSTDAGALVPERTVTVPAAGGPFSASDLILGRVGSGLVWRRPEGEVPLNPLMRYPRDGALELYYELYGLPERAAVVTHVAVAPRSRGSLFSRLFGRRSGVRLEYTTQTDAPGLSRVRQRIELAGLSPGRYDLAVSLRDPAAGTQVVRSQSFEITGQRAP